MNKCFKLCRLCATTENLIEIFDTKMPKLALQRLNTKILYTLGITIQITDKATQICIDCAELVNNFDIYKQNALKINEAVAEISPIIHPNASPSRVSNMLHKMAQSSFSFLNITKQVDIKDEVKSETITDKEEPQSSGDITNLKDCDHSVSTDNEDDCRVVLIDTDVSHPWLTLPSQSESIAIERTVETAEAQLSTQIQRNECSPNQSEQLSLNIGEGNNENILIPTTEVASYARKVIKVEPFVIEKTIEAPETPLNIQFRNSNLLEACNIDTENYCNNLMLKIDDTPSSDEPIGLETINTFDTCQNEIFTDIGVDSANKDILSVNFDAIGDSESNNDSDLVSSIDSNVVLNRDTATDEAFAHEIYPRCTIEEDAHINEDMFNLNITENLTQENYKNILNDDMNIFYFNNEFNDCMDIAEVEVVTDNKLELQAIIGKTIDATEIPLTLQMHRDENPPNEQEELSFEITDTSINRVWVDLEVGDICTTNETIPEPILATNLINSIETPINIQIQTKVNTPKQQEVLKVEAPDIRKGNVSTTDQNKLKPIAIEATIDDSLNLPFRTNATVEYSNMKDNLENSHLSNLLDQNSSKIISRSKILTCWLCKITLSSFRKLRLHISILHPDNINPNQLYSMEYEDFSSKAKSSVLIDYTTAVDCKLALIPTVCLVNLKNCNVYNKSHNEIEKEDVMTNVHYLFRQREHKALGNRKVEKHCKNIKSKSAKRLNVKQERTNKSKTKSQGRIPNTSKSLYTKASTSKKVSSRSKK